jgi:Arc/MetJ-type ribon-helix-helix transcriptional regulator
VEDDGAAAGQRAGGGEADEVAASIEEYDEGMSTPRKERLTVTVDAALVRGAHEAVAEGRASSLSAWVNAALAERLARERRLQALARAVAAYESRHGTIDAAELAAQRQADRSTALVVRRSAPRRPTRRRTA